MDIVDGTPLLDIKPYVPQFDERGNARIGWLEKRIAKLQISRDDGRFAGKDKEKRTTDKNRFKMFSNQGL